MVWEPGAVVGCWSSSSSGRRRPRTSWLGGGGTLPSVALQLLADLLRVEAESWTRVSFRTLCLTGLTTTLAYVSLSETAGEAGRVGATTRKPPLDAEESVAERSLLAAVAPAWSSVAEAEAPRPDGLLTGSWRRGGGKGWRGAGVDGMVARRPREQGSERTRSRSLALPLGTKVWAGRGGAEASRGGGSRGETMRVCVRGC